MIFNSSLMSSILISVEARSSQIFFLALVSLPSILIKEVSSLGWIGGGKFGFYIQMRIQCKYFRFEMKNFLRKNFYWPKCPHLDDGVGGVTFPTS